MVFTSAGFFIFLPICIVVYFAVPARYRWIVLLVASLLFYYSSDIRYLPYILITSLITWLTAGYIQKKNDGLEEALSGITDKDEKARLKENCRIVCKRAVTAAIVVVLGILIWSKFTNKLLAALFRFMGKGEFNMLSILVPLGISYYTLSAIGYMLDVHWKHYRAEKNPLRILLFLIYFPHILQGPFPRYNRLGTQLREEHFFDYKRLCFGLQLMVWGYFLKLVIADRFSLFVSTVYSDFKEYDGLTLLIATVFCCIQMYTDFYGCMSIAQGISEIFGIQLEDNFHRPFFARSVAEYWQRWHITLGAWYKDYLCMPIVMSKSVKSRSKELRKKWGKDAGRNYSVIVSLAAVWICTGLWHGTGINYVLWGVMQGSIIILSTILEPVYGRMKQTLHLNENALSWKAFQMFRTLLLAGMIPKVFTRLNSVSDAFAFLKKEFSPSSLDVLTSGKILELGLDGKNMVLGLFAVVILITVSILQERGVRIREWIAAQDIVTRWVICYLAVFSVIIFGVYGSGNNANAFVYMGF